MKLNQKLFDILPETIVVKVKRFTSVRNCRIGNLTIDELNELHPFISEIKNGSSLAKHDVIRSIEILIKLQQ